MRAFVPSLILAGAVVGSTWLVRAQQDQNEVLEARRLLLEASSLVVKIPETQRPSVVANIAGQLMRTGDLEDGLATARLIKSGANQDMAISSIAWVLADAGNVTEAVALVNAIPNDQQMAAGYQQLASPLAEKGDVTGALQVARLSKDPLQRVDALAQVATQLANDGHEDNSEAQKVIAEAIGIAAQVVNQNPKEVGSLGEIARAQAEMGDLPGALLTLGEFSAVAEGYKGPERPTLFLWLALAQAQIGDLNGAKHSMAEMGSDGSSDAVSQAISTEQAKEGEDGRSR